MWVATNCYSTPPWVSVHLHVILQVALEAGKEDLSLAGLQSIDHGRNGALQICPGEQNELLHTYMCKEHSAMIFAGLAIGALLRPCSINVSPRTKWHCNPVNELAHLRLKYDLHLRQITQLARISISLNWFRKFQSPLFAVSIFRFWTLRVLPLIAGSATNLVDEIAVCDPGLTVVQKSAWLKILEPLLAVFNPLFAESHLNGIIVMWACGHDPVRLQTDIPRQNNSNRYK